MDILDVAIAMAPDEEGFQPKLTTDLPLTATIVRQLCPWCCLTLSIDLSWVVFWGQLCFECGSVESSSSPTGVSDRFLGFLVPVFIAPVWAKSWSTFLNYARSSGRLLESRLADAVTVLLASVGLSSQPLEGCYASRWYLLLGLVWKPLCLCALKPESFYVGSKFELEPVCVLRALTQWVSLLSHFRKRWSAGTGAFRPFLLPDPQTFPLQLVVWQLCR